MSAVIAEAVRRSPLVDYGERFAALSQLKSGAISVRELAFLTQINLRADPRNPELRQSFSDALGFSLPLTPNTTASQGDRRALWLGPDEWLIVGPPDQQAPLEQAVRDGLTGAFGSVADVSANRTVLEIGGASARDLLAQGTLIDLDQRTFTEGRCAQTLLAKA